MSPQKIKRPFEEEISEPSINYNVGSQTGLEPLQVPQLTHKKKIGLSSTLEVKARPFKKNSLPWNC